MRSLLLVLLVLPLVALSTAWVRASSPSDLAGWDDVPPWHWASDAVQRVGQAGIFVGYPATDASRAANALAQVYDAFAHTQHPEARAWAERFLTNLPPSWPQPLQRSRVAQAVLSVRAVSLRGDQGTVVASAAVALRTDGAITTRQARVRAGVHRDADGRWRVDYATLAAAQPEVFRLP